MYQIIPNTLNNKTAAAKIFRLLAGCYSTVAFTLKGSIFFNFLFHIITFDMIRTVLVSFTLLLAIVFYPANIVADQPVRIVAIGDSLMAGKGLSTEQGFTVQLENALTEAGYSVSIVNASVSGDTTSGGLARLDWVLAEPFDAVILFLGQNDAFRAVSVDVIENNLSAMIANIQARGMPILFAGAKAPRNLGAQYYEAFDALYPRLAKSADVLFFPFFLQDVATVSHLNQNDGIHPNEQGVAVIVANILPFAQQLVITAAQ